MFTGIVEAVGTVVRVLDLEGARRVRIEVEGPVLEGLRPGESIAVDGACLTPVTVDGLGFEVEVVLSTLSRTVASSYEAGRRVNLERALALGDRLDGHMVQGHVDGHGRLERAEEVGETRYLTFRVPAIVDEATILHGSIAVNGVSLTVNAMPEPGLMQVAIIPHTWSHTNLGDLTQGDTVNVEGDLLGKYVGRMLSLRTGGHEGEPQGGPQGGGA
jgi:riboflavin synthase